MINVRYMMDDEHDIIPACEIIVKNNGEQYRHRALNELLAMYTNIGISPRYIVAEDEGKIVGVGGFINGWLSYNIYEIFWVNVTPSHQSKGIGKLIISKIIEEIRNDDAALEIILSVDSSGNLVTYYAKNFGFIPIHSFNNTYRLMALKLK